MHVITYDRKYQLEKIDSKKWIPIKWAYQVLKKPNSSLPIIINIANEYAINLFRVQKIKFDDIIPLITKCINHFKVTNISSFPEVFSLQKKINNYLNYKFIKQNNTK
jgi:1-deoxy-D-xylulose-5-phosphate reductoisomerase